MSSPSPESLAASLMGRKGGKASSARLTVEQRVARAKRAAAARWAKVDKARPASDAK